MSASTQHAVARQDTDLILEFYHTEEWTTGAVNYSDPYVNTTESISPRGGTVSSNPVTFKWGLDEHCNDRYPNYQFQLLRLFGHAPVDTATEANATATIDWSKALTIVTDSPDTTLTLTIAEGTGYYLWRVRPIGNKYPGGVANDRNWGNWSPTAGDTVVYYETGFFKTNAGAFFYQQFDDSLNWIYSRTFTEGSQGVRIGEKIRYANGLMMAQQDQGRIHSTDSVLIAETKYDYSGRPAFATLAAPAQGTGFRYRAGFLNSAYTAVDFDADSTWNKPHPITSGILHDYYSDTNPDESIPDATGYPFTRTVFYPDGTSRPREASGAGDSLRIKPSGPHRTTRVMYAVPSDAELIHMFGDEAPDARSVQKIVSLDPNDVATISYVSKEGKTIASCLSVDTSSTALLDSLKEPRLGGVLSDTIRKSFPITDGIIGGTTVAYTQPTSLSLHYRITPATIASACGSYCAQCDYKVIFTVVHADDPSIVELRDSMIVAGGTCPEGEPTTRTYDSTLSLGPGSYIVQRQIMVNPVDPTTLNDSDRVGRHYLDRHIDSVRVQARRSLDQALATVYTKLGSADQDNPGALNTLYSYLRSVCVGGDTVNGAFIFPTSCCSIKIPYQICVDTIPCDTTHIGFEQLLLDMWGPGGTMIYHDSTTDSTYNFSDSISAYFGYEFDSHSIGTRRLPATDPAFPKGNGAFDRLIRNMLRDGYSCATLWDCWRSLVVSYGTLATKDGSGDPRKRRAEFDLLDAFLTCTGKKLEGVSATPFDSTTSGALGYFTYAHRYFKYTLCGGTSPSPCYCEDSIGLRPGTWGPSDHASWDSLYHCVHSFNKRIPSFTDSLPSVCTDSIIDTNCVKMQVDSVISDCRSVCEKKMGSYYQAILDEYHRHGLVVEGDRYLPDSVGSHRVDSTTHIDVFRWQIECKVNALLAECEAGCNLSIVRSGTKFDSVGTAAEREAFLRSMTYNFDVKLNDGVSACPEGYTRIGGTATPTGELLVWYLNRWLYGFSHDSVGVGGGYLNVKQVVRQLDSTFAGHIADSLVFVQYHDAHAHFIIDSCRLIFVADPLIQGSPAMPHPLVDSLNSFLDREWGYRVGGITADTCAHGSDGDTLRTRGGYAYSSLPSAYRGIRDSLLVRRFASINGNADAISLNRYLALDSMILVNAVSDFRSQSDTAFRLAGISVTTTQDTLYMALQRTCSFPVLAAGAPPPSVYGLASVRAENRIIGCGTKHLDTVGVESASDSARALVRYALGDRYTNRIGRFAEDADGYLIYIRTTGYLRFIGGAFPATADTTRFCGIRFFKGTQKLADDICDTISCGPVCFKWVKPDLDTNNLKLADTIRPITCQQ
ncbi:MAG: hypothetical protein ABI876_05370, partial [Bacteroidota bacterium]